MNKCFKICALAAFCFALSAQERPRHGIARTESPGIDRARQQWFYGRRAFPLGRIPAGARIKGIDAMKALERSPRGNAPLAPSATGRPHAVTTDSTNWTLIGPRPTDQGQVDVASGRVDAVVVDPRDNNIVYAGAAAGGVWKTTDGGSTWKPLTDQQPSLTNGAIALDPTNPDTVYVGTGEDNDSGDSYYGAGILKSTDAGNTWTNIAGPFLRDRINSLAVHPTNGRIVLAGAFSGLWRSTDGAATWTRVLGASDGTTDVHDVVFDPTGAVAYAGAEFAGSGTGLYKSTDSGATWQRVTGSGANSLPTANVGRIGIAIAPSNPSTLYAQVQDSSNAHFGELLGIWKSTDSGATWNQLKSVSSVNFGQQLDYTNVIRVHPKNSDVVIAGALLMYRSLDGGTTWQALPDQALTGDILHADQHSLAFTPDGTKLYIANDGGVFSATAVDGRSVTWISRNDTLALTQFYPGMALDPQDPQFAVIGTQDNATQIYTGTANWSYFDCGDGAMAAVDRLIAPIIYTTCAPGSIGNFTSTIFKSMDAGNSDFFAQYGIDQADPLEFIPPLAIDSANPRVLYFGTNRMWRSIDGAGLWTPISPTLSVGSRLIDSIAIAPSDSNVVYATTGHAGAASDPGYFIENQGVVQVTTNALAPGGATWTRAAAAGLPRRTISRIVVDPIDSSTAYVVLSGFGTGHVFRTRDSGANFTDISGNLPDLPANDIVIDPDIPDTLYVANDAGVLVTNNGGTSWTPLGSGLPKVVVHGIALHRSARILRAATHGRSAWDIAVPLSSPTRQPSISSLSPNNANAGGGAVTLTVNGSNFVSGEVVRWNGQSLSTTFISGTQLRAQIPAANIASVGRATITVFLPASGGGSSNQLEFGIGPAPSSSSQAVVSAANPTGGNVLGQRSIASLYGLNLAADRIIADSPPPLPATLGDTSLNLEGNNAPLFFISAGQINFQVPNLGFTRNQPAKLVITHGNLSSTITVMVGPYAPALFTTNAQGTGQGSILIAGTASLAAPAGKFPGSRPVKKGEFISIYCTGLGDVRRRPGLGQPSPSNPLSTTLTTPDVTIGTASATVLFSGLAPGFVGLYQVNVQIPDTAPSGDTVNVSLTIGGVTSNTATIAIE